MTLKMVNIHNSLKNLLHIPAFSVFQNNNIKETKLKLNILSMRWDVSRRILFISHKH